VIDKKPRQIEHPGHPRDDRNDMQRLDPFVHRTSITRDRAIPVFTIQPEIRRTFPRFSIAESVSFLRRARYIRKQHLSKTIILES
jgi:hypothetical protein